MCRSYVFLGLGSADVCLDEAEEEEEEEKECDEIVEDMDRMRGEGVLCSQNSSRKWVTVKERKRKFWERGGRMGLEALN